MPQTAEAGNFSARLRASSELPNRRPIEILEMSSEFEINLIDSLKQYRLEIILRRGERLEGVSCSSLAIRTMNYLEDC